MKLLSGWPATEEEGGQDELASCGNVKRGSAC